MKKKAFTFRGLLIAYSFAFLPFALIAGLLSLFGIAPAFFNKVPYYGVKGFIVAILTVPFFGIIMGTVNWIFLNFGDYVYNSFRSLFTSSRS